MTDIKDELASAERKLVMAREALHGINTAIDNFWNDPERPSTHTMRSNTVMEICRWQEVAKVSLAALEAKDGEKE